MKGLEPVGAVAAPGCSGIEVVGYAEQAVIRGGQRLYYVALRNSGSAAKIVKVFYVGGTSLTSRSRSGKGQWWIQTTAAISPGSSGGGLFDKDGNLKELLEPWCRHVPEKSGRQADV